MKCIMLLVALLVSHGGVGSAPNEQALGHSKYSVRVSARLRPLPRDDASAASGAMNAPGNVVIPLHQRLQLIQAREQCSRTDSRRRLWQSRGGQQDAWSAAEARVPNPVEGEEADADAAMREDGGGWRAKETDGAARACVLSSESGEGGHVLMCCPAGAGIRRFSMDHVLAEYASQEETYLAAASDAVKEFLEGRSACIFAYGQTGSGKSHTIFGATDESASAVSKSSAAACAEAGIVPRACSQVLAEAREICARGGGARVSLSMVELFGEAITDLLAPQDTADAHAAALPAPPAPKARPAGKARQRPIMAAAVLRGMHALPVQTPEECGALLARGFNLRSHVAKLPTAAFLAACVSAQVILFRSSAGVALLLTAPIPPPLCVLSQKASGNCHERAIDTCAHGHRGPP